VFPPSKDIRESTRNDGTGMAALHPIRLAPPPLLAQTVSHRNQMPSSKSLAGGSAYNNRPLVLKGQNVPNFLLPWRGQSSERLINAPIVQVESLPKALVR
jgi:hypothetical protein